MGLVNEFRRARARACVCVWGGHCQRIIKKQNQEPTILQN
jgi:hypothetical protein